MPIFRTIAFVCAGLGTAFWLYTFYYIANVPPGDGTGFQWLGEVPLTAVFGIFMIPAFGLAFSQRTAPVAAGLGIAGLILFAILWMQLLSEFQPG